MSVTVFVGPTIEAGVVTSLLPDARIEAPVAAGDVCRAVDRGDRALLIIDGLYERVPSVWHKEILLALREGVHVYGCSSMGAIRAAELAAFGMVGIGAIYDRFARDELDDDDVAIAHASAEDGYRSMSEAWVNVDATMTDAVRHRIVDSDRARLVTRSAKGLFYPDRTYPAIVDAAVNSGLAPEDGDSLRSWIRGHRRDVKREDALVALAAVGARGHERPFEPSGWELHYTAGLDELRRSVQPASLRPDPGSQGRG